MKEFADEETIKEKIRNLWSNFDKINDYCQNQIQSLRSDDFGNEESRYQEFEDFNSEIDAIDEAIEVITSDILKYDISEYGDAKYALNEIHNHYRLRKDHFHTIEEVIENLKNKDLYEKYISQKTAKFVQNEKKWRAAFEIIESKFFVITFKNAFINEQMVDEKMPGKNGKFWQENDKVFYKDLGLILPEIPEKDHVVIECVIDTINKTKGEIIVNVKIKSKNYEEKIFAIIHGFWNEKKIVNYQLQTYLDFYNESVATWSAQYLFKFKEGGEISNKILKIDEPNFDEFFKVTYYIKECYPWTGMLLVKITIEHTRLSLSVEKDIEVDNFGPGHNLVEDLHIYFENFNAKSPFELNKKINLKNSWRDALALLKEDLDHKGKYDDYYDYDGLFNLLLFEPIETSLDAPLEHNLANPEKPWLIVDITYYDRVGHKGISKKIGKFKLYFSGIELGEKPSVISVKFSSENSADLSVGQTWDEGSRELALPIISDFRQKYHDWETFVKKYNKIKFIDFEYTVHSGMDNFNRSKDFMKIFNNTINLDVEILGVETFLYKKYHNLYAKQQDTEISFKLHVDEKDNLMGIFHLKGLSRSTSSIIYLWIEIKEIQIIPS